MIHAVAANFQPTFREGSALTTCTQKLLDLVTKIRDFFMKILQTILPCVFGKPDPVVAAVTPSSAPQTAENMAAAVIPVVLPARELGAVPAQVAEPAAGPIVPAVEEELPPVALVNAPPMPAAPPAVEPAQPLAPLPARQHLVLRTLHRSISVNREQTRNGSDQDPVEFKGHGLFDRTLADARRFPRSNRGGSHGYRRRGRRVVVPAAAAAPERENQVRGTGGLDEGNKKAGPIVCLEVLLDLWNKISNPEQISGDLLDTLIGNGIITYDECRGELNDGTVSVSQLIGQNRDIRAVPLGLQEGSIQKILKNLQEAKQNRTLLGALFTRGDQTYGIFISSHSPEEANRFIVLDPYGTISLGYFENEEEVAAYFASSQDDADEFSVTAFEKGEGLPSFDDGDMVHVARRGSLTREQALALAIGGGQSGDD